MADNAITCTGVTVRFGDFVALDDVSVAFERGRIHALVGQNGAGKTTLARAIAGLEAVSEGSISSNGEIIPNGDVIASRERGIEMVHQSFALPPSMTVAEALEYGSTVKGGRSFTRRGLNARWQKYLDASRVSVRAGEKLRNLPVETMQSIEIARALAGDARILILDEPTAVLPPESVGRLFEQIRRLKAAGVTVIIVLHKVREVLEIAETVTVLRRGKLILETVEASGVSVADFTEAIIGGSDAAAAGVAPGTSPVASDDLAAIGLDLGTHAATEFVDTATGESLVRLVGVTSASSSGGPGLHGVDLELFGGQIVGVAGVEGNGQVALAETIAGLSEVRDGQVELIGESATRLDPLRRRGLGLRIIPFDRNTEGLSRSSPLWQNWAIPLLVGARRRRGYVRTGVLRKEAESAFQEWDVRFTSVNQNASELSGGNAQKVILARELDADARVIIAAQPTRGLDLGAVEFVWRALRRARDSGAAVLLISSDLDELMEICDRIIVVYAGGIALDTARPFHIAEIGSAMTGVSA
ncbi:ABC transporter ATP-binding protein [Herbiconiux daphne]|uniref:ATP-binding cassette domain-containing protein n=1 Tax=Herbiconiux daphne TaxID=2970914 RepID=A0ABT2H353_9MICO|nr:ATP-binding cassette domain-containing protein [Herbiconiux daphne]MCS5734364.1 ATP-binding cassette domain-containing protein [Herbiconiux daphne]